LFFVDKKQSCIGARAAAQRIACAAGHSSGAARLLQGPRRAGGGRAWLYPPPAAPPLMPNVGPWLGCRMTVTTF